MRSDHTQQRPPRTAADDVDQPLSSLTLSWMAEHAGDMATQAAPPPWSHVDALASLTPGEAAVRRDRATQHRLRLARFPVMNTLAQFRWDWPTRINRLQVQPHVSLGWMHDHAPLLYLGGGGLGQTPLATAWGATACLQGSAVRFASASEVLNTRVAAKRAGRRTRARRQYLKPAWRLLDARGSLPIDQAGADLRCQVLALREAHGASVITSHRACKEGPTIFNNASPLPAAMLDRVRPHAATGIIEGKSCRMQGQIETYTARHTGSLDSEMEASCEPPTPLVQPTFSNRQFSYMITQSVTPLACG
jgi:DNA replication protein DnaC